MARIRSIHPGLFTDEAFASLPMAARVLLIGIWTEADDHGVFEWKPLTLKMKVFPADAYTQDAVEEMLGYLRAAGCIKRVDMDGKGYGLVRNFCLWQRPKKPSYRYPLPGNMRSYVGLKGAIPPPVENQYPTAPEKAPQMEEGGGRRKGEKPQTKTESVERESPAVEQKPSAPPPDSLSKISELVLSKVAPSGLKALGTTLPETWTPDDELCEDVKRDFGMTDDDIRSELLGFHAHHAQAGSYSANWRASFTTWCKRWKEHREKQAPARVEVTKPKPFTPTEADWDAAAARFAKNSSSWSRQLGPEPGMGGCRCPAAILERHGIDPKTGMTRKVPA